MSHLFPLDLGFIVTVHHRVISRVRCPDFLVVDTRTAIGSHVEFYGVVGPSAGRYTVQLDDGPSETYDASRDKFAPRMVLYQDSGLGPGEHTLRVANTPFSGQTLSVDYAIVEGPP